MGVHSYAMIVRKEMGVGCPNVFARYCVMSRDSPFNLQKCLESCSGAARLGGLCSGLSYLTKEVRELCSGLPYSAKEMRVSSAVSGFFLAITL